MQHCPPSTAVPRMVDHHKTSVRVLLECMSHGLFYPDADSVFSAEESKAALEIMERIQQFLRAPEPDGRIFGPTSENMILFHWHVASIMRAVGELAESPWLKIVSPNQ